MLSLFTLVMLSVAKHLIIGTQTHSRHVERSEVSHYLQVTYEILRGKPLRMTVIVTLNTPLSP